MTSLTGERVRRLMRAHGVSIADLARRMNITQTRVRQVRERGVIEGPHYVRDWIEAITARKENPMPSAAQIAARERFAELARSGAFKRKKNPLTRVKSTSPSMATGEPPSKRLIRRRKKTARAPAGFYANPIEGSRAPARFAVHRATPHGTAGALLGEFPTKAAAVEYGQAVADQKKVRVVIVGKSR